ncbi:dihydrolipoyllysine-residue acetyltransferase [Ferrimonas sp.]|uniref:dihydrolipoyllysine-residue acetyltransferase n=1 Tax=Ferrimonas sp. TaxID=2080861 RepID=UPI003A8E22D7
MIKEFILPDIGEGVVECEVMDWLVAEGDEIKEDQVVAEVMTDKALVEIPAPYDGKVVKLHYKKGQVAKVHEPLFSVELNGASAEVAAPAVPAKAPEPQAPKAESAAVPQGEQVEEFILPDIGEGIVECEVAEWLVSEGDEVVEDQPICDVMTDKALVQIPAVKSGTIHKLHYQKGEIAKVHEPLFSLKVSGATSAEPAKAEPAPAAEVPAQAPEPVSRQIAADSGAVAQGKALASPAVRRMARTLNVDIAEVPGSGKNGRVYKEDIQAFVDGPSQPVAASQPVVQAAAPASQDRVEAIRGIKAAMARQMTASVQTIPHFTYCEELDLTELVALRASLKQRYADKGIKLTLMPFIIKAMSVAAKEYPVLNAQVNDDCSEITYKGDHNIGMAVDGKMGLIVPNVKKVQEKSIIEVAQEVTRLTTAARDGRVSPEDLRDGTLSVSNIGALGGTVATPIINKPEVAIVALGKLQTLPRFNDKGEVEARTIMQVSWSGDHRVIDGGTIARFCNLWKSLLENPAEMMLHLS